MNFLPKAFGAYYLQGDRLVFSWLRKLSTDYQDGYWPITALCDADA